MIISLCMVMITKYFSKAILSYQSHKIGHIWKKKCFLPRCLFALCEMEIQSDVHSSSRSKMMSRDLSTENRRIPCSFLGLEADRKFKNDFLVTLT